MGSGESKEGAGEAATAEETSLSKTAVKALGAASAVAAGAALLYHASGSSAQNDQKGEAPKMMKAPGKRGELIQRDRFAENPRGYFRELRERNDLGTNGTMIKILTYNVWFREDVEVHKRMKALGNLIQQYSPEIVCFQEVTPYIYELFQDSAWWSMYKCSLTRNMVDCRPYFCMQMSKFNETSFKCKQFNNSVMGRELLIAEIDLQPNKKLTVATTHLESPNPAPPTWNQMYSKERIAQAKESIETLKKYPNVVFGGDMNWNDKQDGDFPLASGWIDAWSELKSGENGWTYDTVSNKMLTGGRKFQARLDRFVCCLKDFRVVGIEMIGKDAVPGASYVKEKKVKNEVKKLELPVWPSDHYGLLLTVQSV